MNTQNMIQKLEGVVRVRTPQYVSLNNPQYDEKLMKAHYLLARLCAAEGDNEEAHSHFREAEHEFFNMCRVETEQPHYISSGLEGFRKFQAQERKTEKKLEHYKGKLFNFASKIGYDATSLLFAPTNSNPNKSNLTKIIKEYAA